MRFYTLDSLSNVRFYLDSLLSEQFEVFYSDSSSPLYPQSQTRHWVFILSSDPCQGVEIPPTDILSLLKAKKSVFLIHDKSENVVQALDMSSVLCRMILSEKLSDCKNIHVVVNRFIEFLSNFQALVF